MNKCKKYTGVLQGGEAAMQITSEQKQNNIYNSLGGTIMFKEMKKRIKNEKGLTLIELLAVIVILAIIAAIAIPAIGNIIDNSRYKAAKSDAIMVLDSANLYFTDNSTATSVTVSDLISKGYMDNAGTVQTTSTVTKVTTGTGNTLGGTAVFSGKTLTFTNATLKIISDDARSAKEAFGSGKAATIGNN